MKSFSKLEKVIIFSLFLYFFVLAVIIDSEEFLIIMSVTFFILPALEIFFSKNINLLNSKYPIIKKIVLISLWGGFCFIFYLGLSFYMWAS